MPEPPNGDLGTPSGTGEAAAEAERVAASLKRETATLAAVQRIESRVDALVRRQLIEPALAASVEARIGLKRFGLHSQFEEDGMTLEILSRVHPHTHRFVEIGCGENGGNSGILAGELGWSGLMVDRRRRNVERSVRLNPATVKGAVTFVTRENIDAVIADHGMGGEIDFLSIDIDGNDIWILEGLTACRPRVVVVEYNAAFGPDESVAVPYDPKFVRRSRDGGVGGHYFGASLAAIRNVATGRGYRLVAVEPTGANAYFVRDDLAVELTEQSVPGAYRMLAKHAQRGVRPHAVLKAVRKSGLPLTKVSARPAPTPAELRRTQRAAFFAAARQHTSGVISDTPAGRFLVEVADEMVGGKLFAAESRGEIATLETLFRLLDTLEIASPASGATFVDVGANIGTTTVPALLSGRFTRGVAIEAAPANQRLLRANLALNGLNDCVEVVAAAAGRTPGRTSLVLHPTNSGGHEIDYSVDRPAFDEPDVEPTGTIDVEVVSLDTLAAIDESVTVVWIDAQGYEGHVLDGARTLANRGVPILMEFWPDALRASGGLDLALSVLEDHYSAFVDIRRLKSADSLQLRSIDQLRATVEELGAEGRRFTDLAVFRPPSR